MTTRTPLNDSDLPDSIRLLALTKDFGFEANPHPENMATAKNRATLLATELECSGNKALAAAYKHNLKK